MVRIFLEGKELDVNEGFSQQITYAVDDLQNLDSKSTAFSKTIVIPGTSNNNKLFGNIFEFTNSNLTGDGPNVGYNFNASKAAKVRLEINGLTAIKGVLRLLTIIHDGENIEYEVAIFGELGGFVNALGNKKLENLDFSYYNHDYTIANIEDSWNETKTITTDGIFYNNFLVITIETTYYAGDVINITGTPTNDGQYTIINVRIDILGSLPVYWLKFSTNVNSEVSSDFQIEIQQKGRGYYYPLIDYGLVSTNKQDYKYNAFRPAFYVREYMDKIIRGAGYTYESNFFDSDFFRRLIVPNNQNNLQYYQSMVLDADINYTYNPGASISSKLRFFNVNTSFFTIFDNEFTPLFTEQTFVRFRIRAVVNISPQSFLSNNQTFGFDIQMGYSDDNFLAYALGETIYSYRRLKSQGGTSFSIDILTDYIDITQQAKFIFSLRFFYPQELTFLNSEIEFFTQENNFVPVLLGDPIRLNELLPKNILQKDFFTSILKMFYLMVTEDKDKNNHLIIEPWVEFYNLDRASYLDWSDKIDRSQPIKIVPMSEINSRYYNLNYKSDNDYFNEDYKKKFNEGYGNVVFDNQLDFAKDSSTTEVVFSATPLTTLVNGQDKIVSTIFKWDGTTFDKEERVSSNIRILQSKLIEGVTSWDILDLNGTTVLDSFTNYPYAGHLDDPDVPGSDLSFGIPKQLYFPLAAGALGNNLFNTFYSSYLAEITDKDSRLVIAKIKLTEKDIFNLDFSRFIWIDGVLYRLSRIIDYTAGEICTIELLRVIYTTYLTGSPAQVECILTEDSICLTTEDDNNLTIEN